MHTRIQPYTQQKSLVSLASEIKFRLDNINHYVFKLLANICCVFVSEGAKKSNFYVVVKLFSCVNLFCFLIMTNGPIVIKFLEISGITGGAKEGNCPRHHFQGAQNCYKYKKYRINHLAYPKK